MDFELEHIKQVYLIGIGGIGMSALARWFKANGREVFGYDRVDTMLTDTLQKEGIDITFEDKVTEIPEEVLDNQETTLVIYTPAVPTKHKQLAFLKDAGYLVYKRSVVLGFISKIYFTVAVAGTHGKTTTSSMLAHILNHANQACSAFVGGISKNFASNLLLSKADPEDQVLVVEADEYDRSFLTLHPDIAVVTSIEPDHLDIYGNADNLKDAFIDFIGNLKSEGQLFIRDGVAKEIMSKLAPAINLRTFGISRGDYSIENIRITKEHVMFDLINQSQDDSMDDLTDLVLKMPGEHNVVNMAAAVSAALSIGISPEKIKQGVATYSGVTRRFDFVIKNDKKVYIDDYAHHPTEIDACLRAVKALYPKKKLTVVFQPHLYTRTRDFTEEFAHSLSLADELILLDIYPARELPIAGVSTKNIYDMVKMKDKWMVKDNALLEFVDKKSPELLVTIGAGNIDRFITSLKKIMEKA